MLIARYLDAHVARKDYKCGNPKCEQEYEGQKRVVAAGTAYFGITLKTNRGMWVKLRFCHEKCFMAWIRRRIDRLKVLRRRANRTGRPGRPKGTGVKTMALAQLGPQLKKQRRNLIRYISMETKKAEEALIAGRHERYAELMIRVAKRKAQVNELDRSIGLGDFYASDEQPPGALDGDTESA